MKWGSTCEYKGCLIQVKNSNKKSYKEVIGSFGIINRYNSSSDSVGVTMNDFYNNASNNGTYWFESNEIELVDKLGGIEMEGYNNVAIVNLLEDYSKKDYAFALYDSEWKLLRDKDALVVVNAKGKDNRILGIVKRVITPEEYGKGVNAQVVGVVNMDGYIDREEEQKREVEIKKQKDIIETELKDRLRKLQDAAFYEKMAKEYEDKDPELVKLVEKLKKLGE